MKRKPYLCTGKRPEDNIRTSSLDCLKPLQNLIYTS